MTQDSTTYLLQRSNVTREGKFWAVWRSKPNPLKNYVTLRNEVHSGKRVWFAYRMIPKDSSLPPAKMPKRFRITNPEGLLKYQIPGVEHLCASIIENGCALDGSDTGIGKTYIALAVCREMGLRPYIICKKAGFASWEKALKHFGLRQSGLTNWERAKRGNEHIRRIQININKYRYHYSLPGKTMLIFDEAHEANNMETQNCSLYISSYGIPSLALSATFADRPSRMYPFIRMTGAMSHDEYREWLKVRGEFINNYDEPEPISSQDDMLELNKMLFPAYGYRLSYDNPEVKSFFPDGVYRTNLVSLSKEKTREQNKLYKAMIQRVIEYAEKGQSAGHLIADLRYRQSAELLKAEALFDLTRQYILEGKSVAIFVNFRDTLNYLAAKFKTRQIISGDQKHAKYRQLAIDKFQSGQERIILCMVDAGGQSLDLHDTIGRFPRVSLICPTYKPITLKQVLGRTRRAGSKSTPVMQLVYAAGTVEEKVAESVNKKLANISALNDGDLMEPDLFKMGVKID